MLSALLSFLNVKRNAYLIYAFLGLILIVIATFRSSEMPDYDTYNLYYDNINKGREIIVESSFVWLTNLAPSFIILIAYFAIIGVTVKMMAVKNLLSKSDIFLALVVYCSGYFVLNEMIQIRAGVASGLMLVSLKYVYDRNLAKFIIVFGLAFLFHYSSIIILPLWFIRPFESNRKLLMLAIPFAYLCYFMNLNVTTIGSLLPIAGVQEKFEIYSTISQFSELKPNVFNLILLAKIVIFYFCLLKINLLQANNKYAYLLVKVYGLSIVSFIIFVDIAAISFRFRDFYGVAEIALLPLIPYIFKQRVIGKAIVVSISFFFLIMMIISNTYKV